MFVKPEYNCDMETVRWILGVLLLLAGLGAVTDNFGLALAYIAIGGALLPPVIPFIQEKFFHSRDESEDINVNVTFSYDDGESGKDAWEGDDWDFDDAAPCEASIEIEYIDAAGLKTTRAVDVQYCSFNGDSSMFKGLCYLRNAQRMFKFSRVQSAVDLETGEVVRDLENFLRVKYEASPYAALTMVFDQYMDNLRALLYVGKADGQLRQGERGVIYDFIRDLASNKEIPADTIRKWFDRIDIPSLAAYRQIVGRISKQEKDLIEMTLRAAEDMSGTNKNAKPAELEAIEYMRKRFGIS